MTFGNFGKFVDNMIILLKKLLEVAISNEADFTELLSNICKAASLKKKLPLSND